LGTGRYRHLDLTIQGGDLNPGTKGGLPGCHRQIQINRLAIQAKASMRQDMHFQKKITIGAARRTGGTLASETNLASFGNTSRDLDLDLLTTRQGDRAMPALMDFFQGHINSTTDIGTFTGLRTKAACLLVSAAGKTTTKDGFKKITKTCGTARSTSATKTAKSTHVFPAGWRIKVLPLFPVTAELIVGATFVFILQDFIGLGDLLEARLGVSLLADIRMILTCKPTIGLLDLVVRGPA
jgi:hypothetical protein